MKDNVAEIGGPLRACTQLLCSASLKVMNTKYQMWFSATIAFINVWAALFSTSLRRAYKPRSWVFTSSVCSFTINNRAVMAAQATGLVRVLDNLEITWAKP